MDRAYRLRAGRAEGGWDTAPAQQRPTCVRPPSDGGGGQGDSSRRWRSRRAGAKQLLTYATTENVLAYEYE